jgi:nitrite reductase/ring-hydroxylating ferredoxin subunit
MPPHRVAANLPGFFRAASLANLEEKQMMTVQGADRPVLLCCHKGQVFALDNRCPHMGFPLAKGSLDHGLLTCHWHRARFDLSSGCAFDLWADDTSVFEVRVEGDDIWLSEWMFHWAKVPSMGARIPGAGAAFNNE